MLNFGESSNILKRPEGQILNLLDWAISGGPAKWCDDVTHDADRTIARLFITADNFTINAAKTLTLTALRPLIVVADTITINGTITASGKGCSASASSVGYRYTGWTWPFSIFESQAASTDRNYCLCGSGGGSTNVATAYAGGGAFKAGGAVGAVGNACDLTDAELKELLFSPLFNIFQIGLGGSGGARSTDVGGIGGGSILLIGKKIILGSTASILANGIDTSSNAGAGGGGFIGLIADTLTVHGSATVTANKGAASGAGFDGGDGVAVQINV